MKPVRKSIKFFIWCVATLGVFLSLFLINLPNVAKLRHEIPVKTSFMKKYEEQRKKNPSMPSIQHQWKQYSRISPYLIKSVLIAEDDTFFSHHGFNWAEIKKALEKNWKRKAFSRGASTITQQLVKNLYLSSRKTPFRKIREWILTIQVEHTLSKKRILELYLNYAEWGKGIYGAEAAAQHYFKKSSDNLTPYQAAFLAALLPNPSVYAQRSKWTTLQRKIELILERIKKNDIVTSL